ncbi:MAG: dTDP-4-dehydrorhamnose 3,5-epimerase [Candidatus Methanoperedens sp.]|nr:dTDP-4-dehydrorhamnose 3,5-epimerase [Candidatus Methanoperedens sp.]
MIFTETKLKGAFIIDIEKREDNRGFFSRVWCMKEFDEHGLNTRNFQSNIGFSPKKGTMRGLHYQLTPYEEAKLVRCTMGSIYDVIVDLRQESQTYKQWFALELTGENRRMVYIPERFAHGYLTLENNSEVFYQSSEFYYPEWARGIRYDDPAFRINWPIEVQVISENDKNWPLYIS